MDKTDIRDLTLDELAETLAALGEPRYRARQIFQWIYRKGAPSFAAMKNLPGPLREKLASLFVLPEYEPAEVMVSADGTEKILVRLADGKAVESVIIPAGGRSTLCVSTQVGCRFACAFCASGRNGFSRNLTVGEIAGQLLCALFARKKDIDNVVFMGMGEPLDNLANVLRAVRLMNAPEAFNIGARKIAVSTSGVVPGILEFAGLDLQVRLSISLHAADDVLRSRLMPVNRTYPLAEVLRACETYTDKTGRRVTLEYCMLDGVNDSPADAAALARIALRLAAMVNLIRYSPSGVDGFRPTPEEKIREFVDLLDARGVKATVRASRGRDIDAACGQLAGRRG